MAHLGQRGVGQQLLDQRRNATARRRPPGGFGQDEDDDEAYFNDEAPEASQGFSNGGGGGFGRPPATQAPTSNSSQLAPGEVDPLDEFMAQIDIEVSKHQPAAPSAKKARQAWEDQQQEEDPVASYFEAYSRAPTEFTGAAEADQGADSDDIGENGDKRNKAIEPLPAIDHTKIKYNAVRTDFYTPHEEIEGLDDEDVKGLRQQLRISATGYNIVSPVASFAHLEPSLGAPLMAAIQRHGYEQPTPIQAQAIPVALKGRDLIGIAETGSGKTAAYLLPMLVHCLGQEGLQKGEGPIGIVLCPTRELAVQIETETKKFNRQLGLNSVTLAGGLSKLEQFKDIKRGCEIAICNPGRLIDVIKMKGCTLRRTTFVVLDEADRMFSMGFEYQVRSIVQNVRPSRQVLLFSATFPPKIEKLARDILFSPVRITVGQEGQVAANVEQHIEVLRNDDEKWAWLSKRVEEMLTKGQLLIFVKSIASAEELTQNFNDFLEKKTETLHGDLDQGSRMQILKSFKKRQVDVLIATDVAARGLDLPNVATVVSYDAARDLETHTHRVGRTGRGGNRGEAFTLLTRDAEEGKKMAASLAEALESQEQTVSEDLNQLALRYGPYRAAKLSGKKFESKKKAAGKAVKSTFGLGFDGASHEKETSQELEQRLNKQADTLAAVNRRIMAKAGAGRAGMVAAASSMGAAGFVAAATKDNEVSLPANAISGGADGDSSDSEDLFAPGVSSAFGKAGPAKAAPPKPQPQQHRMSFPPSVPGGGIAGLHLGGPPPSQTQQQQQQQQQAQPSIPMQQATPMSAAAAAAMAAAAIVSRERASPTIASQVGLEHDLINAE